MGTAASQITSLTIVYSTVYSDADQRKHLSSASLAFVRGMNSPHKWPVTRKMFPFHDMIMSQCCPCPNNKDPRIDVDKASSGHFRVGSMSNRRRVECICYLRGDNGEMSDQCLFPPGLCGFRTQKLACNKWNNALLTGNNDFGHSWVDSPVIFTRDCVTWENHGRTATNRYSQQTIHYSISQRLFKQNKTIYASVYENMEGFWLTFSFIIVMYETFLTSALML